MDDFDDLFADDNSAEEGSTQDEGATSDTDQDSGGESYFEKLKKEKGYKNEEDVAKAYVNADQHIKRLENENSQYRDWIKNRAAAAVKLAKEYIETDEYKKKYGGESTGQQKTDTKKKDNTVDIENIVRNVIDRTVNPKLNQLSGSVETMSESGLMNQMKESKEKFPYMTKEVEKDMKDYLKRSREMGNPYPVNPQTMANLYNSFVGKNIKSILEQNKDITRQEVLRDIAQGKASISEADRLGEGGNRAKLDETSQDIADMFNAHKNPLSF